MAQARPWPPGRWPVSDRHAWLHLQPVPMAGWQVPFRFASWPEAALPIGETPQQTSVPKLLGICFPHEPT